jgi:cytochrome c peroxidase
MCVRQFESAERAKQNDSVWDDTLRLGSMRLRTVFVIQIISLALVVGCGKKTATATAESRPIGATVSIRSPLGLPQVPIPDGNPPTDATIALGRRLFYDVRLSADGSLSCASCHNPTLGFSDGRRNSKGFAGKLGSRNAPTVLDAAYSPTQFWDGRAASLEDQAGGPIANPIEMNQAHDVCVSKLDADPSYKTAFARAFGPGPVTMAKLTSAVASFERTLISGNSRFDRYEYGGDKKALNAAEIRGLEIFRDEKKGDCAACHTIGSDSALFTDGKFHNIGVGVNDEGELTDLGRYEKTHFDSDKGAFKTPTLRNIAITAPYMHDGSLKTLKDVVDFYAGGGNSNPYLDPKIKTIHLSGPERADLTAFLESLTGDPPPNSGPPTPAEMGRLQ